MVTIQTYIASFGTWYSQVRTPEGDVIEFSFDHEPTTAEVEATYANYVQSLVPPIEETTIILEAENGIQV